MWMKEGSMSYMKIINKNNIKTLLAVVLSAAAMACVSVTFTRPAELLAGGFLGIATLIELITEQAGITVPASVGLLALNIPTAILCYRGISPRFVIFSLIHVALVSLFLQILPTYPLMDDAILNVIFGGVIFGGAIVLVLKAGASTGGSDFIALYVSNRSNKEVWIHIFVFNVIVLCIFGYLFGFEKAGYSILFQFISMKTISTFHIRYKRVMLHIFTKEKDKVVSSYFKSCRHGLTIMDGMGGYSKQPVTMMTTVISTYEVDEVISALKQVDPSIIINVTKSENYVGRFYMRPID